MEYDTQKEFIPATLTAVDAQAYLSLFLPAYAAIALPVGSPAIKQCLKLQL